MYLRYFTLFYIYLYSIALITPSKVFITFNIKITYNISKYIKYIKYIKYKYINRREKKIEKYRQKLFTKLSFYDIMYI